MTLLSTQIVDNVAVVGEQRGQSHANRKHIVRKDAKFC